MRARPVPAPPSFKQTMRTVGVTGTNGKTTTTAWVAAALAALGRPVARATTVGCFLDEEAVEVTKDYDGFVELMRQCVERGGHQAAIELTSEALFHGFGKAWPCEVGVFTNLTHDHLDAHGTPEHYLASKAQLFLSLPPGGTAVLNASDDSYEALSSAVPEGVRELTYGVPWRGEPPADTDVRVTRVSFDWQGTTAELALSAKLGGGAMVLRAPAVGEIFAENAIAAWLGAVAAGVPAAVAAEAIGAARPPPGRFEVVAERPWVVVDYAHTPDALKRTLQTARTLCKGALWVVFGAGGNRDRAKRAPMGEAASVADRVVLTTDNPRDEDPGAIAASIRAGIRASVGVEVILDRREAIASSVRGAAPDDVIVIAGRGHETDQIIGPDHVALSDAEVARAAVAVR